MLQFDDKLKFALIALIYSRPMGIDTTDIDIQAYPSNTLGWSTIAVRLDGAVIDENTPSR